MHRMAAAFALAGAAKLRRMPSRRLMPWVDGYSLRTVRLIGVAELAGAAGLLLAPLAAPAAAGLGLLMLGGVGVHLRRRELLRAVPAAVLLGGCIAVLRDRRAAGATRAR
ncbi:DoxX family protein [Microbacteriaceae bacterium VKM Ac-2854]|nr:DoxX family protein [Microbacteriaceae bacterium VKM Ac-2854]